MSAMEVIRKYTAEETEAYRANMMEQHIKPYAQEHFEGISELKSAVFFVAQYWDDEAMDAVHHVLRFSLNDDPDIAAFLEKDRKDHDEVSTESADTPYTDEDYMRDTITSMLMDGGVNDLSNASRTKCMELSHSYIESWNDNGEVIAHFAAFTTEEGNQESCLADAYTPYAILRRGSDGCQVEIVGTMLRPWLDGVAGNWEARDDL